MTPDDFIDAVTTPIIESDRLDNANGTQSSDQLFTMSSKHSQQGAYEAEDLSVRTTMNHCVQVTVHRR